MPETELAIFDCDGVLVDSETILNAVLAQALATEGLPTTLAEARRDYQGMLLSEVVTKAQTKLGRPLPEGWLTRYERDRAEAFHRELKPVPDAAEAVKCISAAGIAVCVASQGKLSKTRLTLGLTGLRDLFSAAALFSAEAVPRGKPHPDIYLYAASAIGVKPSRCVVVEDTPLVSRPPYRRVCARSATSPTATRQPCARPVPRCCDRCANYRVCSRSAD